MKRIVLLMLGWTLTLSAFAQNPVKGSDNGFDFDKYKDTMQEFAIPRFAKSEAPVVFVEYALVDIDGDGLPEVWVRGDEGQDWQGVFSVEGDSVVLLADADVTSEISFYKNAVGYSGYISPGRVDEGFSVIKNSRIVASCEKHMEFNIFSDEHEVYYEDYTVNNKDVDEETYNDFVIGLGEKIKIEPLWHRIR